MRWLSVVSGSLTTLLLFFTATALTKQLGQVAQLISGGLVALLWASAAQIVEIGVLAIPDSLIYPCTALALLGSVWALESDAPHGLVVGLIGAIGAVYLKYSLVYALIPVGYAALILLRRRGLRAMWPTLGIMALISAGAAAYLIWGYGAFGLNNTEANRFRDVGLANLLSLERNGINLWYSFHATLPLAYFGVGIVAGALAARHRQVPRPALHWLLPFAGYALCGIALMSSVKLANDGYGPTRYLFPVGQVYMLIFAVATAWWARANIRRVVLLVILVGGLVSVNLWQINLRALDFAPEDFKVTLWRYADATLPNDGTILFPDSSPLRDTFNRPHSGYNGATPFTWAYDDNPTLRSPQSFFDEGAVAFLIFTERDLAGVYNLPEFDAYREQLLLLKQLPAQDRPDSAFIYYMLPPQTPTDVAFGEQIRLVGYDLNATTYRTGEVLRIRPYWQAAVTPQGNYSMFVHLVALNGDPVPLAQFDGAPSKRLTPSWSDPSEVLIGTSATIALPPDLRAGNYQLILGLYDFMTGVRLPADPEDAVTIPIFINGSSPHIKKLMLE